MTSPSPLLGILGMHWSPSPWSSPFMIFYLSLSNNNKTYFSFCTAPVTFKPLQGLMVWRLHISRLLISGWYALCTTNSILRLSHIPTNITSKRTYSVIWSSHEIHFFTFVWIHAHTYSIERRKFEILSLQFGCRGFWSFIVIRNGDMVGWIRNMDCHEWYISDRLPLSMCGVWGDLLQSGRLHCEL